MTCSSQVLIFFGSLPCMMYASGGNFGGAHQAGMVGGRGYAAGAGHGAGSFHAGMHGRGAGGSGGGGACGCDDGCGAGGTGCGTSYDTTGVLSYVGNGGDYKQETTYTYVGRGAGDFEMVGVPTNFRSNICVCLIPLLLLLLLVPLLLYLLPQMSASPTTTPAPAPIQTMAPMTTSKPFDCKSQGLWSFDKKGWCCKNYGVGCPTKPPPAPRPPPPPPPPAPRPIPSTTSPCPFDCNAGYNEWPLQWVKGWTGAKKMFCCRTAGRGCPSELPPPSGLPPSGLPGEEDNGPFDCNAGYHNCFHCLKRQWSPTKLRWCCTNQNKGCQSNTPA